MPRPPRQESARAPPSPELAERYQSSCLCPGCPAYPEADAEEGVKAYCLRGDSAHKEQIEPKDCFCENCEVYKRGAFHGRNFYCLTGTALEEGLRNLAEGRRSPRMLVAFVDGEPRVR